MLHSDRHLLLFLSTVVTREALGLLESLVELLLHNELETRKTIGEQARMQELRAQTLRQGRRNLRNGGLQLLRHDARPEQAGALLRRGITGRGVHLRPQGRHHRAQGLVNTTPHAALLRGPDLALGFVDQRPPGCDPGELCMTPLFCNHRGEVAADWPIRCQVVSHQCLQHRRCLPCARLVDRSLREVNQIATCGLTGQSINPSHTERHGRPRACQGQRHLGMANLLTRGDQGSINETSWGPMLHELKRCPREGCHGCMFSQPNSLVVTDNFIVYLRVSGELSFFKAAICWPRAPITIA
mmetsp:Transcript_74601/g.200389  ORF Transcript_74601/g.200389 Transcript_74601/m.200389 type:complete len:299 (+) Transcript_74601:151-1047(+)